jgi:hypothetical protein
VSCAICVTAAVGGLDGPRARLEPRREPQQPLPLIASRVEAQLVDHRLGRVEHRGSVGVLVRVDPDREQQRLLQTVDDAAMGHT